MTFLFDTNMMKAKSKIPVYLDKVLEQHVFQLVVDVNLPFNIVEHPKFISLVNYLKSNVKVRRRKRVIDILDKDPDE